MQTHEGPRVGSVIDRYRVVRALGGGTMGDVFEAEHVELGTRVALKVLHPHHQGSDAAARFLREGKTLGLFRNRHIVELLEVGRGEDGSLFLATELVRGVSLRDLIADGVVEPRRALTIARQVLEALSAAHAVGVIHRDVKPENIMLADGGSEDGTDLVKVLDFGVAKLVSDTAALLGEENLTRTGLSVLGSPHYIAPEVALGRAVDPRADLYAVGVVLFEMITGKPPFDATDPTALLRLHTTAPIPTLAERAPGVDIPAQLSYVVNEALAKNPDVRFRSATEMSAAIEAALQALEDVTRLHVQAAPPRGDHTDPAFVAASPRVPLPAVDLAPSGPVPSLPHVDLAPSGPVPTLPADRPLVWPASGPTSRPQKATPARSLDLLALLRKHTLVVAGIGGALLLVIILAVALGGSDGGGGEGDPAKARELLALGHERFTAGRKVEALGAYERAVRMAPSVGGDATLRDNAMKAVEGKEPVAAVLALELLATSVKPPAHDVIASVASTGKVADVRRRAVAIAERDGFAAAIDRVESASLDLAQATSCDERRLAIDRLAASGDKRALAALRKAKAHKCVEKEASDAIARLETGS